MRNFSIARRDIEEGSETKNNLNHTILNKKYDRSK